MYNFINPCEMKPSITKFIFKKFIKSKSLTLIIKRAYSPSNFKIGDLAQKPEI